MTNISITLDTNKFFGAVLKSPIQRGSLSVNNSVTNISRLGTFKCNLYTWIRIQQLKLMRIHADPDPCRSGSMQIRILNPVRPPDKLGYMPHSYRLVVTFYYPAPGGPVQCDPAKQRRCGDGMRCYDLAKHCDFNVCIPIFDLLIIAVTTMVSYAIENTRQPQALPISIH
jgi:hypothetical protein